MARLELGPVANYGKRLFEEFNGVCAYRKLIERHGLLDGMGRGVIAGTLSYIIPITIRGTLSDLDSEFRGTLKGFTGSLIDIGIMSLIGMNSHSVSEFLAYKTIANLGSHVMVDAISFGVDRLKNLRPPTNVTLAV